MYQAITSELAAVFNTCAHFIVIAAVFISWISGIILAVAGCTLGVWFGIRFARNFAGAYWISVKDNFEDAPLLTIFTFVLTIFMGSTLIVFLGTNGKLF